MGKARAQENLQYLFVLKGVTCDAVIVILCAVNPVGQVVATSINPQTNTVNSVLRKAAEDAARKARFNTVDGVTNQTGKITYYFKLREYH